MSPDEISPVELAVMLSLLPPGHVLVTAARAGIEVGQLRAEADELRTTPKLPDEPELIGTDKLLDAPGLRTSPKLPDDGEPLCLDDYVGGQFHRANELAEYTELQRHRWPPTGDRDLWIRYGPDGPPRAAGSEAAA